MCAPEENEFGEMFVARQEQFRYLQRVMASTSTSTSTSTQTERRVAEHADDPMDREGTGIPISDRTMLRRISRKETNTLRHSCRCHCRDWSNVFVLLPRESARLDQSEALQALVSETNFDGVIVLDMTATTTQQGGGRIHEPIRRTHWHRLPPGVHSNLMICDSVLRLTSCRVYRNSLLSNTFVGVEAVLVNCGSVSVSVSVSVSTSNIVYACGRLSISVGAESGGGRSLELTSEHTMIDVCRQLRDGPASPSAMSASASSPRARLPWNIIGDHCILRDTPSISNVYLHAESSIEAATSVSNVTLFPKASIGNACTVSDALLQWDSTIMDHSTVSETLLMEQAHCGPSSIVASTVLGPDVHVSAGEIHSSIIGPNTNAHHQSLLIGVLWPMGRGNVGYGANVGSNHTGRLPDQETAAGEGTFWGLSTVIKFPVDLTYAPYSIVAAGTTLTPQRVCMPFSLILEQPSGGGSEIIPGWVLQSSPYTLTRSEKKFATRRKAKRHHHYTGWRIFRPEIIDMCRWAKAVLERGPISETNTAVTGVGASKLTDRARAVGIRAYTDCIQRYALQGLLSWVLQVTDSGEVPLDMAVLQYELSKPNSGRLLARDYAATVDWPLFPWEMKGSDEWEYQRGLLTELFPTVDSSQLSAWLEELLQKLVTLEKDLTRRIHKSKQRDDSRGANTIPGYANAHISADKDPVILEAQKNAESVDSAVADILGVVSTGARSRL